MITKPMLAGKCEDITKLTYPVLATPKLDGIRCLIINGKAVSRKFKPIPNDYIRQTMELSLNSLCLDGEIMVEGKDFNELSGDVRRKEGRPDFKYYVFDILRDEVFGGGLKKPYDQRMHDLDKVLLPAFCKKVCPRQFNDAATLTRYEEEMITRGYEGIMVRSPDSPYKCGRSTSNEGYLLKIKRFEDDEATIVAVEEMMHNDNVATKDAFGRSERSSHKENLRPAGKLGKLVCRSAFWQKDFEIGTGFDAAMRDDLWRNQDSLIGKTVKFKHQPTEGAERPRFPVFLGFRDEWDM